MCVACGCEVSEDPRTIEQQDESNAEEPTPVPDEQAVA
jgi:hypothetical protein